MAKSKTKYKKGERITSLDELAKETIVFLPCGIKHHGWWKSMQFRLIESYLKRGIYKAVREESDDDKARNDTVADDHFGCVPELQSR